MFVLTMPVACHHVRLFLKREHLVDVTEIFRALSAEKKFRLIKLASFSWYLSGQYLHFPFYGSGLVSLFSELSLFFGRRIPATHFRFRQSSLPIMGNWTSIHEF